MVLGLIALFWPLIQHVLHAASVAQPLRPAE